jgi:putative phosphoesterase
LAERYDADVIVYGHTHRQVIARVGEKLIVNPGAAGARRFDLVPCVAILWINDGMAESELVPLE